MRNRLLYRLSRMVNPRWVVAAILVISCMVGLGVWAHHAVAESLRKLASDSLSALLQSNMEALEMWIEAENQEVQSWAQSTPVIESVTDLVNTDTSGDASKALIEAPAQQNLRTFLNPALAEPDAFGYLVTNREGLILAAREDKLVGRRLTPDGQARNAAAFASGQGIFKPLDGRILVDDVAVEEAIPVILCAAVVSNEDGQAIAVLSILLDPEQDFSRILSVGRLGATGSTYAIDSNGIMLSELRHETDLRRLGLIDDTPDARSTLIVPVRDPGGNLLKGYKPKSALDELPLTRSVASAVTGRAGVSLEPYRDYRGVSVVGAWTWLPYHDFGVVTELDAQQLMNVLRPLRLAFWGMFTLIVVLAAVLFFSTYLISRMRRSDHVERIIGQYTLLEKIGEGGMGSVYKARHSLLRRPTAVKLLAGDKLTPELITRFEREVQVTSQLTHPNTVEVYDYGRTENGEFYYVMEYIEGINLAQLLEKQGKIPPARVVHLLQQVCGSLAEAHEAGLIHRDIKPLNIMLCKRGGECDVVKVLDFGLVKEMESQDGLELTGKDIVRGTPMYISPERLRNPALASPASDIYSIGVLAFNLSTGQDPFSGKTPVEVAEQVLRTDPVRVSSITPGIPKELDDLVYACLQKEPLARPQTVRKVLQILLEIPGLSWTREDAEREWAMLDESIAKPTDANPLVHHGTAS